MLSKKAISYKAKNLLQRLRFYLSSRNSFLIRGYYSFAYTPKPGTLAAFYDQLSRIKKGQISAIQVGANDGITHDPLHKFIKRDHWNAVLIEPQSAVFRNALFPIYLRDPQVNLENCAISETSGLMDLYSIAFCGDRWATGLSTFHLPTLQGKVERGEIDRMAERFGIALPEHKDGYIKSTKVECKTFAFLREKYHLSEIDVLQIDTEGFDAEIINMYDLSVNRPGVIVFENSHLSPEVYAQLLTEMQLQTYEVHKVRGDCLAIRSDYTFGKDAFLKSGMMHGS